MTDTFTPNVGFRNQTEGGNANQWGVYTDDNWELNDNVLGDTTLISTSGGDNLLTDDQELVMALDVSGTLVTNATIEFSGRGGSWIIKNETTGAFTLTAKVTGQTGLVIEQGAATLIWCDGTDIRQGVPTAELASDPAPRLSADLDTNGHNIGFDDGTGINDEAGNEQVVFHQTASAVNQVGVTNAATNNAPQIAAEGGDTNIDLKLAGKGTGGVIARFKQALGFGLLDSDSSNALLIKTSENLSADHTLDIQPNGADRVLSMSGNLTVQGAATLPAGTSLVASNNLSDVGNAATAFGNIKQNASTSASGVVQEADQAAMEARTSGRAVTADVQHFHPAHVKAGGNYDETGTPAFRSGDVGMGAITNMGTGDNSLAFDTSFNDTNYWCTGFARHSNTVGNGGTILSSPSNGAKLSSSMQLVTARDDNAYVNVTEVGVVFYGDYA
jgi:hypothetical protein